ncbi:hypothetical protein Goklo_015579 [Gossypium klotzschianum]|uniref:Uncharacterized protein n=1 Tax=Gossypium klotzschianum TaxID=34286 RepID=A0A7J8UBA3_9ROSI|nr:hypothetical protein [Gossypium klotzschianum]
MEKGFLDKVEDNATIQILSEKTQQEKANSLTEGYVSELWDFTRISVTQNNLQELKEVWDQWDDETKQLFYRDYGRFGAHRGRVHNSAPLPKDPSQQSLF